jgi:hypothetical protein
MQVRNDVFEGPFKHIYAAVHVHEEAYNTMSKLLLINYYYKLSSVQIAISIFKLC